MINVNRIVFLLVFFVASFGLQSQTIKVDTATGDTPGNDINDKVIEWVLGTLHGGGGYFYDSIQDTLLHWGGIGEVIPIAV